jgi:hypothetical protein
MQGRQRLIGDGARAGRDHVTGFDGALPAAGRHRFARRHRLAGGGLLDGLRLRLGPSQLGLRVLFRRPRGAVHCGDPDLCTDQHTCDHNSNTTLGHGKSSISEIDQIAFSRITLAFECDMNKRLGAVRTNYRTSLCSRHGTSEFHAMRECRVRSNHYRQTEHSMRNESVAG